MSGSHIVRFVCGDKDTPVDLELFLKEESLNLKIYRRACRRERIMKLFRWLVGKFAGLIKKVQAGAGEDELSK